MFLISFIGQSYAAISDTCSMPDKKSDVVQMDHSMHNMDMSMIDSDSSQDKKGCCEGMDAMSCSMDTCLMSSGIATVFLMSEANEPFKLHQNTKIDLYTFFDPKSDKHSLFRPPIIR